MQSRLAAACAFVAAALAGCDLFVGESEGPPLPGERISVLSLGRQLVPDPDLASLEVRLPPPYLNADWPQAGGFTSHAMHHLQAPESLNRAWTADIGEGGSGERFLLSEPIVAAGRVFTMDAGATVKALDVGSGKEIWSVDLTPEDEDDGYFGGGLAYDDGRVIASTMFGIVYGLDAASGAEFWRELLQVPMRAPPAVSGGRAFAVTLDNQLFALAAEDGRRLWSHAAIAEDAGLLGGAAPAVVGDTVIGAFSSGEIVALRVETGRVLWSESLAGVTRGDAIATLADVRGEPVVDRELVLAVSNSGTMSAIDLSRGNRVWTSSIASTQTPWVAGDFVFVISNEAELVCLTREDGRIKWVTGLPRFEDEEARENPIVWSGPMLAGDRLIVTGSSGEAFSISPYTGEIIGRMELSSRAHLPPIAAGDTIYILTDDAALTALR
ncbi:MAG: PQQ-binding-like beta-propeller repeat protein [Dongiaceae bacterium]